MTPWRQNRTKLYRRLHLAVYIVVFFIAAPWLVLTAAGYQIDWVGHRLLRTGVLTIASIPENASVFIDDQLQSGRTPVTTPNLTPRDYTVRLEKPGYQPWSKRLTIRPNGGTIVNDVLLFAADPMIEPLAVTSATAFSQSPVKPDRLWLQATTSGQAIQLEHIDRQRVESLGTVAATHGPFVWSPSGDRAAIITDNGLSIVDLITETIDQLTGNVASVAWESNSSLLTVHSGRLDRVRVDPLRFVDTGTTGWGTIASVGDRLVGLHHDGAGWEFGIINHETFRLTEPTTRLSVSDQAQLLVTRPDRPVITDPSNRHTIVLERRGDQFVAQPLGPVGPAVAWNSQRQLLLSDGFELQYWDEATGQTALLNRFSQVVSQVAWLGDLPGVIYRQAASISAMEMDERGGRQITPLLDGQFGPMAVLNNGRDLLVIRDGQPMIVRLQP